MAARNSRFGQPAVASKRWYADCEKCGAEKEVVMAHVLSLKAQKKPMCTGCREFVADDVKRVKK